MDFCEFSCFLCLVVRNIRSEVGFFGFSLFGDKRKLEFQVNCQRHNKLVYGISDATLFVGII
jgi:hypothetical protein